MYYSKSDESDKPGCSDSESGHPGKSQEDVNKQLGNKKRAQSVKLSKISEASATGGNIALATSSRSDQKQGNREGHVPSEGAEPYNGGKFI